MTPKQKAEELFYRCPIVELGDDDGIVRNDLSIEALKDVLLFLVDEILNCEPKKSYFIKGHWMTPNNFWREVKEEIKKLR